MNTKLYLAVKKIFDYLPEYRVMNIFGLSFNVENMILERIDERMTLLDQAKLIKEIKEL